MCRLPKRKGRKKRPAIQCIVELVVNSTIPAISISSSSEGNNMN